MRFGVMFSNREARAPTATDDFASNYRVGATWLDTVASKAYVLLDHTVGAAVWAGITLSVPADGSITPEKLDRSYIESSFGEEAEGESPGILRRILRIWVQNGKVYGESDDEI